MPIKAIISGTEKEITRIPVLADGVYKDTWEVRDNQDRLLWYREDTLTGTSSITYKGYGIPLKSMKIVGNGQQTGTPSPDNIIMSYFCGVKTENLWDERGFSANAVTYTNEHTGTNKYGTTLSTTIGKEVVITQSVYPTGNAGYQNGFFFIDVDFRNYNIGDKITLSFDYIVNEVHALSSQTSTAIYAGKNDNAISPTLTSGDWKISGRLKVVITIIADMLPYVEVRLCGNSITVKNIMLNSGSTALPYEPYGYKIPVTNAGQTTPGYLGEVPTVRQIKKLVLTGEEVWSSYSGVVYLSNIVDYLKTDAAIAYCSHYQQQASVVGVSETVNGHIAFSKGSNYRLCIRDSNYTSGASFATYLAAQYAAGTPVTVWYVLATPTTAIINEPLAKIGDYADELITVPGITPQTGTNTLTVDTTLSPSSVSITGHIKSLS